MNNTSRVANRVFLLVVGLALVLLGAAAIAVATLPSAASVWRQQTLSASGLLKQAWALGPVFAGFGRVPWVLPAAIVVALGLIVLLVWFAVRQGGGRTGRVVEARRLEQSAVRTGLTVDVSVARGILQPRLQRITGVSGVAISAYRVKRAPAMKVSLSLADGADPVAVLSRAEAVVGEWDAVMGEVVPVFVHLLIGTRAALAQRVRAASPGIQPTSIVE